MAISYVALEFALCKERLCERGHAGCDELSGIHDHPAERVGESALCREGDFGEEGTPGGLNAVEGLCQFGFGNGDIRSVGEEREWHADTEGLGEAFGRERCALDGMRGLVEQKTQRVFDFVECSFGW